MIKNKKIVSIFGTRPEMIKMWGTLTKLDNLNFDHIMVHTGQNFTPELKDFFFKDLKLRKPDYQLNISTSSYSKEVADVLTASEELFKEIKPDGLLILGDTFSGLSTMVAAHMGIKIFHMEAGLRAYDRRMPEQRNRILIDHLSTILLPFRENHKQNLIRENIHPSKIIVTGNPTFEVMRNFKKEIDTSNILNNLNLKPKDYILYTAHRSENVDNPKNLRMILDSMNLAAETFNKNIIFPMHPRTKSKLDNFNFDNRIIITDPIGFYDFNFLLKMSFCVLSDSGTAAEEGLFYKVPSISLRYTTERPETIESGAHILSGLDPNNIVNSIETAVSLDFEANYDFNQSHSPSSVVINSIQSEFEQFF